MNLSALFDKRRLVVAAVIGIVLLLTPSANAAKMKVANVAAVDGGFVQFDISWADSWRASWKEGSANLANWDAAWIFVKYRVKGDAGWRHATLSPKSADHSGSNGAEIEVGLTGSKAVGVFLHRAADGKGDWSSKGVKLKWLYKDDKVADPSKVELSVHALEMVYVPQGAFYLGSEGAGGSFTAGPWKKGGDIIPFKVTSEAELKIAPEPNCLYGTGGIGAAHQIGPAGTLPPAFPKGFSPFYCMKYEILQGQYAAFLNQLTQAQAGKRYPRPTIKPRFLKGNDFHTVKKTAAGFVATKPENACNWVSWDDCAAYLDWAGLRPMTELEFEKACRGPRKPVANEYAWGTGELIDATWLFEPVPAASLPAPLPQGICGKEGRVKRGCSYWGIAAMSGHLRERTVAAGDIKGRLFTGICGDGAISATGLANVPKWPGAIASWTQSQTAAAGFRGGPWYKDKARLFVSDRFLASCQRRFRDGSYGFRGVR